MRILLGESHPAHELPEPRIRSQPIKFKRNADQRHPEITFFIALFHPLERVIITSQLCVESRDHERWKPSLWRIHYELIQIEFQVSLPTRLFINIICLYQHVFR